MYYVLNVSHDVIGGPTPVTPTPEPGSLTLLGAGLVALGAIVRRRQYSGASRVTAEHPEH
jgi:hypothetical protein